MLPAHVMNAKSSDAGGRGQRPLAEPASPAEFSEKPGSPQQKGAGSAGQGLPIWAQPCQLAVRGDFHKFSFLDPKLSLLPTPNGITSCPPAHVPIRISLETLDLNLARTG